MSSFRLAPGMNLEALQQRARGAHLPGHFGIEFTHLEPGLVRACLAVRPELMASNGYLHAATVIALADTSCGFGTVAHRAGGRFRLYDGRAEKQFPRHGARGRDP
jgi:1,4-dihydroxy-2-naphthoyl-CoA hydrolase